MSQAEQLLPVTEQLLGSRAEALNVAVAAAAGMWCTPVGLRAAPGQQTVHVMVPQGLLEGMALAGRGVRLVASLLHEPLPVADVRLLPGLPTWPRDGVLDVSFRLTAAAPQLLLLRLVDVPAWPGAQAPDEEPIATIPLLVLPPAAGAEMELLW
jgi:hypothetical protein